MQSKTPMVIVLRDGEEIHGMIEWYDKSCLKVARNSQSNLLIYKPAIKYMFKEGEKARNRRRASDLGPRRIPQLFSFRRFLTADHHKPKILRHG